MKPLLAVPFERTTGFAPSKGTGLRLSPSTHERRTKRSPFIIPLKKSHVEFCVPVYFFYHISAIDDDICLTFALQFRHLRRRKLSRH
jgi:hypothetical protein